LHCGDFKDLIAAEVAHPGQIYSSMVDSSTQVPSRTRRQSGMHDKQLQHERVSRTKSTALLHRVMPQALQEKVKLPRVI
jgi:hypothetical protein